VHGNVELLARAIFNLFENTANQIGPAVSVSVRLSKNEGNALIEVGDDGSGIPPELRHEVVQQFRQQGVTQTGPGSGLELSIVQSVMACHDGKVEPLPSLVGARFRLVLPLA
jgi:K+-sensing histidine kinase KdpD